MSEISKRFSTTLYEAIYLVDEEHDGLRLDQYCAIYLPSFSRQQIKKKISAGQVVILSRTPPHKPSSKVYHKEKIKILTPKGLLEDEYWRGEKLELQTEPQIIEEDENFLIIVKPPYMATHPTGKHLFNCVTVYFEEKLNQTVHSIHRLDRETSGIQIIGKNPAAAEKMGQLFEKDHIAKGYFLIAHKTKPVSFPLKATERLGQEDNFKPRLYVHCYDEDSQKGKHAQTDFHLLIETDLYIIALAFPLTGRQHQIRAHAAFHGFPLIGDKLYNGDPTVFMRFKDQEATVEDHDRMQISRHALHAIALSYPDPYTHERKLHISHPAADLNQWLEKHLSFEQVQRILGKIPEIIEENLKKD